MKKQITLLTLALCCMMASAALAQIDFPQPSPLATVNQKVGLTDIELVYSRPSVKGRKVFGDLVPYGKVWRTAANMATKFTFSDDVTIGGKPVPKGSYALFTIPGENEWTVIINKNFNQAGTGNYKEEEDVARFTVKPTKTSGLVETFTINFADLTDNSANIEVMWENTKISFPIGVTFDEKVEAQIKQMMNPARDANMYYQAASYYFSAKKDMNQALTWINKSLELRDGAFWIIHLKAKIQAELKDYKGAIATAERSRDLAKTAKNEDYVKLNEDLIAQWKKAK